MFFRGSGSCCPRWGHCQALRRPRDGQGGRFPDSRPQSLPAQPVSAAPAARGRVRVGIWARPSLGPARPRLATAAPKGARCPPARTWPELRLGGVRDQGARPRHATPCYGRVLEDVRHASPFPTVTLGHRQATDRPPTGHRPDERRPGGGRRLETPKAPRAPSRAGARRHIYSRHYSRRPALRAVRQAGRICPPR